MKIATWNVNGIRARQAQFCEWLERDRPDVVCLQELKAEPRRFPSSASSPTTTCTGMGCAPTRACRSTSGRAAFETSPHSVIPSSTWNRASFRPSSAASLLASVYVPNGGKDYAAKLALHDAARRRGPGRLHAEGRELVLCGDMNITRSRHGRAPEGAQAGHHRPAARRSASCSRHCLATTWWTSDARSTRTIPTCSPGGRRGATCASAISAGASITSSPPRRSPRARRAASCWRTWAPAITRRW